MRTTTRILVAGAAAAVVAGCGADAPPPRFVAPASAPPGATAPAAPAATWPAGIVTTTYEAARPFLSISDPDRGRELLRVALPKLRKHYWDRGSFSADWSRVAWTTGSGPVVLHVAQLRGDRYVETASWRLPGSDRRGAAGMAARFSGTTSRVWTGWFAGESDPRLYSVDATRPGATPRRERGTTLRLDSRGRAAAEKTVSVAGKPDWGGVLHRTDREALYAVVQSAYTCDTPVAPAVLACWGRGAYGSVATLTAQGTGGRIAMRKLVPESLGRPVDMVASPDGRMLLVAVPRKGWYAVPVSGSAEPKLRFRGLEVGYALPIDWR